MMPSSWRLTCVVDGVVRLPEVCELFFGGADQHVVHEEGVVRATRDHPDPQPNLDTNQTTGSGSTEFRRR